MRDEAQVFGPGGFDRSLTLPATKRTHSITRSATGLKVRFFKVKMATGLVCIPRLTGSAFTMGTLALNTRSMHAGITVR